MNGKPWTAEHTAALERLAGRPDREIAEYTGHAVITVKRRRSLLGLPAFRGREHWTRRDWLMSDAAGLDFQISF